MPEGLLGPASCLGRGIGRGGKGDGSKVGVGLGRSLTHKTIVIEMFLQGLTAHQIARRIFHTEEAVDAYIKVFDRVLILRYFGMPENLMQRVTGHSIALLKEHLALAEKHFPTKEALMEYLGQRNISLDMTG